MSAKRRSTKPTPRNKTPRRGRVAPKRIDATTDDKIARQIASSDDEAPEFTDEMFRSAQWVQPPGKTAISLRVDTDVLEWFRGRGDGYQSRMNQVLRSYMIHCRARP